MARSVWGWGLEERAVEGEERDALAGVVRGRFGLDDLGWAEPPDPDGLDLPPPRVTPPGAVAHLCAGDPRERAGHAYGKAFRDVVRGLRGDYPHPPDLVALPRTDDDVGRLLDWCSAEGVAAVPYGGGSSVVGGVEPGDDPTVSVDLREMRAVLEVDGRSRAARIQGGAPGPAIEDALRPHALTLRHYPQSFEFSTLGGWIATRSAGHHATLATHIEDRVEGLRLVTPAGPLETPRLPASGAGPDPNRIVAGSEGTLGIITEAWMRVLPVPEVRASASVRFGSFDDGLRATEALAGSGLHPATCRLLDPEEALMGGAGDGSRAVLLLGFESPGPPVDERMGAATDLCRDHGGEVEEGGGSGDAWRGTFLRAPYLRDALVRMGMVVETFETAATWDRLDALHASVARAARDAAGDPSMVTVRLTHVYPDGAAPYFTVLAPAGGEDPIERWDAIKAAVSDAVLAAGGTITHHHAVGRVHRPWYDRERPGLFADALRAAKGVVDPAGIMNPGVLV